MSASIWAPGNEVINVDAESTNKSQVFAATSGQTVFTLTSFSYTPASESISVYRGGQRLIIGVDWIESSSTSITLQGISLEAGEVIEVVAVIGAASSSAIAAAASAADAAASAASISIGNLLVKANNLSDLVSVSTARSNLGLGTVATLNVGTSANQVVQLNGTAKLPAVDGSLLTNLPIPTVSTVPVRQTVLSGPVDTNGASAFGGSTGSTTVTASGTIKATAAAGGDSNYTGSITNPSWTGLSTNGTIYLYFDITSGSVVTTGSTTLAPTYRWGGADIVTNNQFTFNIQEMLGKVGNGSTASQVYRVFAGEVTVAGGVVTAITWYQLMGRYESAWTNTLPGLSTAISANHKLGLIPKVANLVLECITADGTFAVGEQSAFDTFGGSYTRNTQNPIRSRNTVVFGTSSASAFGTLGSTGSIFTPVAANWKYKFTAERGW